MKNNLKIIIAGGAGFVGSSLAIYLKKRINNIEIFAVDNLIRKGSSLNINRLEQNDINFINGDLSNYSSFKNLPNADFFIDAAADPSAGHVGQFDALTGFESIKLKTESPTDVKKRFLENFKKDLKDIIIRIKKN